MMPPRADAPKVGKMKPVEPPKVAKMRGFDAALDYYLGPTGIPDRLRALNSMLNPVETLGGSMRASQRMLAPDTAPMGRVQAAGDMLSGVAGFAAPMVAASKVGVPAASAVADAFTGLSTGAQKAGATVVDRLNQPGPMPTLYSNPIPGLMGPKKGIKAYHGSPHSFDKFSMDKIGTGEGAQAYGHGLYFADSEAVAKSYRDALADGTERFFVDGQEVFSRNPRGVPMDVSDPKTAAIVYAAREGRAKAARYFKTQGKWGEKALAELNGMKGLRIEAQSPGSMYEVQINADPADFLDWDKPLSEQPQKVRDALAGHTPLQRRRPYKDTDTGKELYYKNTQGLGGGDIATGELRGLGIPGIRYLDAGSRGAGDGSRNYVVFDDKLIEILRKYGLAGVAVGAAGMSQPKPAKAGIAMGK